MRKNYRNKIRLMFSLVTCSLFIIGGFSTITMKSTNIEINQTKQEQQTLNTDVQKVSIDDIRVVAMGEQANTLKYDAGGPLECDAGGPYVWDWFMQFLYTPPGVRFHGSVQNETNFTALTWDFGDGTVITGGLNNLLSFHFYNQTGIYNITLTARDNSTTPPGYASDNTTLWLSPPCPSINITVALLSIITIKANITNPTGFDATYVNWMINISWGLLQNLKRTIANGTIERIKNGDSVIVQNERYFFGFGLIHVTITVQPENIWGTIQTFRGFKIGPLIFLSQRI